MNNSARNAITRSEAGKCIFIAENIDYTMPTAAAKRLNRGEIISREKIYVEGAMSHRRAQRHAAA